VKGKTSSALNPGKIVAWERFDFDIGIGRSFVFPDRRNLEADA
jgi:hypothetical protein